MQSHGDTAIGITGMDEASGQIEVIGEDCGKGVVGFLVGRIGTPIYHCPHLLLIDGVRQQRTVMSLHGKGKAISLTNDVRLHTVTSEDVL